MIARNKCVICYDELNLMFVRENYPLTASPPSQSYELDIFMDQTFYKCKNCSCVQLGTLINPEYLYSSLHNNTSNTPTWKEHHSKFAEFIKVENEILEIGGSGIYYDLLKIRNPTIEYSCLDLVEPLDKKNGINYYKGNCETFTFPNKTLVLSHVFEHLYNPRQFVANISASNVYSIYISIPNMFKLIDLKTSNVLHNEHTFYIDKSLIEWLFAQYGYTLCNYYEFKHHSLFFLFQQGKTNTNMNLENKSAIAEKIKNLFDEDAGRLKNIKIKENSFIMPAGLFGQFLYYICSPKILGFIDNDITKQNKRVYGTPYFVYSLENAVNLNPTAIYILAGPYKTEIVHQINSTNKNIEIIEL